VVPKLHIRKLPLAILTCVVLFVTVVTGILVTRARTSRVTRPAEPAASSAEYRIKEVRLQEQGKDGIEWQLEAEYGEIFEKQGKTTLRKVTVRVSEPTRQWRLSGDDGELRQATKDVELRGNVVVESSDGLRIETQRVYWTAGEERAWGLDPVTIRYGEGVTIEGQGFEVRPKEAAAIVRGRVRATLVPGKVRVPERGSIAATERRP
jgi:LPS export ABC transporter protein LptC